MGQLINIHLSFSYLAKRRQRKGRQAGRRSKVMSMWSEVAEENMTRRQEVHEILYIYFSPALTYSL